MLKSKIIEISNYHSSALHWNLKEIKETLPGLIDIVKLAYDELHRRLDVEFHNSKGLQNLRDQFLIGVDEFMNTSRSKAKDAKIGKINYPAQGTFNHSNKSNNHD
jgi:ferredoxin-NADP reductase